MYMHIIYLQIFYICRKKNHDQACVCLSNLIFCSLHIAHVPAMWNYFIFLENSIFLISAFVRTPLLHCPIRPHSQDTKWKIKLLGILRLQQYSINPKLRAHLSMTLWLHRSHADEATPAGGWPYVASHYSTSGFWKHCNKFPMKKEPLVSYATSMNSIRMTS